MKYIFIINPVAGVGEGGIYGNAIKCVCEEEKLDYEIFYTTGKNSAVEIVKKLDRENNIIYSVGGDGTLSEVVNGMMGTKNKLGIIPSGSGNDFYRVIKEVPFKEFKTDIGKINDHYFIGIASLGFDAEVGYNADLLKGVVSPKYVYLKGIMKTFFNYKYKDLTCMIEDNKISDTFSMVTLCNGKYYGGGVLVSPNSEINDGYLDLYLVKKVAKIKIPYLFTKIKQGKLDSLDITKAEKVTEMSIESTKTIKAMVDGEIFEDNRFCVSLIPQSLMIYNDQELVNKIMKYERKLTKNI